MFSVAAIIGNGQQWTGSTETVSQDYFFIATVDSSGRVTIPAVLRTLLGIETSSYARMHVTLLDAVPSGQVTDSVDEPIVGAKKRRAGLES